MHKVHYIIYNIARNAMDTRTLQLFLHLADTLHFGETSRACFISPSALSRQIMRLEEELGTTLFIRDNRRVSLTGSGEIFTVHARRMLLELEKAEDRLGNGKGELRGRIRLFCSVTACYSILPGFIPRFRKDYPGIRVDLKTGDAASAIPTVLSGDTDIAVAAFPDSLPPALEFREITTTPLVFIAPKDPDIHRRRVEDLPWHEVPLIITEREPARRLVEDWFRLRDLNPAVRSFVSGNEAIMAMVGLGLGIGVVPRLVVEKSPVRADVVILGEDEGPGSYTVGLCAFKRTLKLPRVRALWDEV